MKRDRGVELKTLNIMTQERDKYRKWINDPTLKGNREYEKE